MKLLQIDRILIGAFAAGVACSLSQAATQVNYTWTGTSSTSFTDGGNWTSTPGDAPGVAGLTDTSSTDFDVPVFSAAPGTNQPYLGEDWTTGALVFTYASGGYTLSGAGGVTLRLNADAASSNASFSRVINSRNTSGTNTISVNLLIGVGVGSSPVKRVDIQQSTGGTLVLSGKISDVSGSGTSWGINLSNNNSGVANIELTNNANDFARRLAIGYNESTRAGSVTLKATSVGMAGSASALGTNSVVMLGANTGSYATTHTLNYVGAGETSDKNFLLDLGRSGVSTIRTIDTTGSTGNLILSGQITGGVTYGGSTTLPAGMHATLRLTGTNTGDSVTGVISDRSSTILGLVNSVSTAAPTDAVIDLNKTGTGTWTLAGLNTYTGNTAVDAGALVVSSTGGLTFALRNGGASNSVTVASGATFNFNGRLSIDMTAIGSVTNGESWTLVGGAGTINYGGTFSVASTVLTFSDQGSTWTASDGSFDYTFSELTGVLTATTSAVPEPSSFAVLAGLVVLGCSVCRRSRRMK